MYYAVKKGRKTGIFGTWKECEKSVKGFSGALYKKFPTKEACEEYLGVGENIKTDNVNKFYVDGSYNDITGTFGYGCVHITPEGEIYTYKMGSNNPVIANERNVAGEILGSVFAMNKAVSLGLSEINIYYDYIGISGYIDGSFECRTLLAKEYNKFYKEIKDKIKVNFVKVQAHSGVEYNEMADNLAKQAVGIA